MSQKHKIELLVTERNCQEFGEGESPSKIAEMRNTETTSCPFSLCLSAHFFYPALSKEQNMGIFLKLPIGRSLVLAFTHKDDLGDEQSWCWTSSLCGATCSELGSAPPHVLQHTELVFGSPCSQGVQFNSRLTVVPMKSCLSPLSLFLAHSRK